MVVSFQTFEAGALKMVSVKQEPTLAIKLDKELQDSLSYLKQQLGIDNDAKAVSECIRQFAKLAHKPREIDMDMDTFLMRLNDDELWAKGMREAMLDEEYLREEKILAEAGVSDGIE